MGALFFLVIIQVFGALYFAIEYLGMNPQESFIFALTYNSESRALICSSVATIIVSYGVSLISKASEINPKEALKAGLNNPSFSQYHNQENEMIDLRAHAAAGTDPLKVSKQKTKSGNNSPKKKKTNLGADKNAVISVNKKGGK